MTKWPAVDKVYIHGANTKTKWTKNKKEEREKLEKPGLQLQPSAALTLNRSLEARSHATVTVTANALGPLSRKLLRLTWANSKRKQNKHVFTTSSFKIRISNKCPSNNYQLIPLLWNKEKQTHCGYELKRDQLHEASKESVRLVQHVAEKVTG